MRTFTEEEDRLLRDATIRNIDSQHLTGKAAEEYAERTQAELIKNHDARRLEQVGNVISNRRDGQWQTW